MNSAMKWSLIFSLLIPALVDMIVTLVGQPRDYWNDFTKFFEGSPGGSALLAMHPLAFVGIFIIYLAIVAIIFRRWNNAITYIAGIALFVGHAWGSSSWIPLFLGAYNWYAMIAYFIFISIPLGCALHRRV